MYCVNDCIERFSKTYQKIQLSGLIEACSSIQVVLSGPNIGLVVDAIINLPKVNIVIGETNVNGESNTLSLIHQHSLNFPADKILYLHSKGVTKNLSQNIVAWVDYMEYFLIEKYKVCLNELENHETVGVEYYEKPMKHYSGNFWWANCSYINKIPSLSEGIKNSIIPDPRWYCEFWLLQYSTSPCCLHRSGVDLYGTKYTRDKYTI